MSKYTYQMIKVTLLYVDQSYQRMLDYRRVNAIVNNFNPNLVNAVKVSYRDGKYFVFDGQHTLAALKLINKDKPFLVECKVYTGLTKEEEAKLFAEQNGISRCVETIAKLKSLYTAKDIDVVEFTDTVKAAGFILDFSKSKTNNRIVCAAALFKIYKKMDKGMFNELLEILRESWHGETESLNKEIINGLAIFLQTYKGDYNKEFAVKQFSKVAPVKIIREGKTMAMQVGNKRFASQFVYAYNHGKRTNKLDITKLA